MKAEKYRLFIGSLVSVMSAIYFLFQGVNVGVNSHEDIVRINAKIKEIVEKPNKRKQFLHYTFYCQNYDNEFFISPDYTDMFWKQSLELKLIENPNLSLEVGIKKSSKSSLNTQHRINVYSIETQNDYYLNLNRVIKKNKQLRILNLIGGTIFLLIGIFCFLRYKSY